MAKYRIQEAEFELPEPLLDKTINIFSPAGTGASEFSVVINRDEIKDEITLLRYTERQLIEMEKKFSGFKLLRREDVPGSEPPAVDMDYQWKSHGVQMFQRQRVFLTRQAKGGPTGLLTVTASAKGKLGRWEETWNAFMKDFRLREP